MGVGEATQLECAGNSVICSKAAGCSWGAGVDAGRSYFIYDPVSGGCVFCESGSFSTTRSLFRRNIVDGTGSGGAIAVSDVCKAKVSEANAWGDGPILFTQQVVYSSIESNTALAVSRILSFLLRL